LTVDSVLFITQLPYFALVFRPHRRFAPDW
jgi:hypothetical protein